MPQKKSFSSATKPDPDDAPELTDAFFADAEICDGDTFVRRGRGRGRPKAAATKEQINVSLDADVLAALRAYGPGSQSRINAILRDALELDAGNAPLTA